MIFAMCYLFGLVLQTDSCLVDEYRYFKGNSAPQPQIEMALSALVTNYFCLLDILRVNFSFIRQDGCKRETLGQGGVDLEGAGGRLGMNTIQYIVCT